MNFFNFKRKHWIIVGIFLAFNVLFVIGFAVFISRLQNKARLEIQRSLVAPSFQMTAEEKRKAMEAVSLDGALTVKGDTCTACESKRKEMEAKNKIINNAEVR